MVFFKFKNEDINSQELIQFFYDNNVKINGPENGEMRFVTHYWVKEEDVYTIVGLLKEFLSR